jgi:hypothetical protein
MNKQAAYLYYRKSGAGDHGQEGIDNYVKVHTCVDRCESMRFEALDLVGDE